MKRTAAALILTAALAAPATRAQEIELGIRGGYYVPTGQVFRLSRNLPPSLGGITSVWTEGRNDAGPAAALNLTAWLRHAVGVDLGTSLRSSNRATTSSAGPATSISVHTLRLLTRVGLGSFRLHAGAGPALVHFDGVSYNDTGVLVHLAKRTFVGGSAALQLSRTVGHVPLYVSMEDAIYKPTLERLALGVQPIPALQHDLLFGVGVAVPMRR